jgi:glycosyltransferase involved in cell wall biosynthesis
MIPSRIESIPVIFSDAMKSLCPVIASHTGDLPALVENGPVGVVAASVGAQEFAEAISRAIRTRPADYANALNAMAIRFSLQGHVVPKLAADLMSETI